MEDLKTEIEATVAFWAMVILAAIAVAAGGHVGLTAPLFIACVALKWSAIKGAVVKFKNARKHHEQ